MPYQKILNLIRDFNKKEYKINDSNISLYAVDGGGYDITRDVQFQIKDGHFFLVFEDWNDIDGWHEIDRFEFELSEKESINNDETNFPSNCKNITCKKCRKCYQYYVIAKMAGKLD